jgi:hypothetical protein
VVRVDCIERLPRLLHGIEQPDKGLPVQSTESNTRNQLMISLTKADARGVK